MRIVLLQTWAHPEGAGQAGAVLELPDTVAAELVRAGVAIEEGGAVEPAAPMETAEPPPAETAMLTKKGKR